MVPQIPSKADKAVKRKIIDAANSIRRKYLSFKLDRSERDDVINKFFNPIKEPLTKLVTKTDDLINIKKEEQEESYNKNEEEEEEETKPKIKKRKSMVQFKPMMSETFQHKPSTSSEGDDNDVFDKPLQEISSELEQSFQNLSHSQSYKEYLSQYPEIAREYVHLYYTQSNKIDNTYGLKHSESNDAWSMGNAKVNFLPNGDIQVGNIIYKGTRGLYELLFLKEPIYSLRKDNDTYNEILNRTSAHRRGFDPSCQIKGSGAAKYKQYIQPLLSAKSAGNKLYRTRSASSPPSLKIRHSSHSKSGSALLEYNEKPKQYVYYDDVNELIDRLVKLDASQEAGNGNNINEIMNILEELVELGVIEFYK